MKATWLGQAGLLFEGSITIMIDPYLSNSVEKVNPRNYRRAAIDERFLKLVPDVLIITHNHLDHADPDTLEILLGTEKPVTVLAPYEAWSMVRRYGEKHNYVLFDRHTQWSEGGVTFRAVRAEHSDKTAVGVIIEAEGRTYYITGDTLYNTEIFADLPQSIDVLFLPINGVGNNMNMEDAALFAEKVGARAVVPIHWGMFDEIDPSGFMCRDKVIPKIYEIIKKQGECRREKI